MPKNKFSLIILAVLLILGLTVRLYKITGPIADWHSFRQADTASVTRNYATFGLDLLHPTYHDLSNIQSGLDNPQGYRMVEFPLYNAASLAVYRLPFGLNLELASRLVSIICSLITAIFIYLIVIKLTQSSLASLLAVGTFLFLPFSIFYSRAILPESMAVMFMTLALYSLTSTSFIPAGLFLSLAILTTPYTAILVLPFIIYSLFHKSYFLNHKSWFSIVFFGLISLVPFLLWRLWIQQFPAGIPVNLWLLNTTGAQLGPEWFHGFNLGKFTHFVAFRPYWFRWLFYDRLGSLILGIYGVIPLFLGLFFKRKTTQPTVITLSLGILLYFIVVAQGNIQHDYYQALITSFLAIIIGVGLYYMATILTTRLAAFLSLVIITIFSLTFSWYRVGSYYQINNGAIITAGQAADKLLPKNAVVIAPYAGDTTFLYQTNRPGWPLQQYDLAATKKLAQNRPLYLVSVNYDDYTNSLVTKYPALIKNDQFVILNLNQSL